MLERAAAREILHQRAVVDDDRARERERLRDRQRGAEAAARAQRSLRAPRRAPAAAASRGVRQCAVGIEQRAVDVEGQQARAHGRGASLNQAIPAGRNPEIPPLTSAPLLELLERARPVLLEQAREGAVGEQAPCVWQAAQ